MKLVNATFEILSPIDGEDILGRIELAARTCYKSEDKITEGSARGMAAVLLKSGHHSVLEHVSLTVRFICDRGVSHELVRHRLAAYSQESTRYANYAKDKFGNEITVIRPFFWEEGSDRYRLWHEAMLAAEKAYLALITAGAQAQEARSVLPNSLKTEVVMTCNLREWRHVLNLRCSPAAHPQIREIMRPLLFELHRRIPVFFDDLFERFGSDC